MLLEGRGRPWSQCSVFEDFGDAFWLGGSGNKICLCKCVYDRLRREKVGYLTASLRVAVRSVEFIDSGHKGCVRAGLFADHTKPRHMLSQLSCLLG